MRLFELKCTHRAQCNYGSDYFDVIFHKQMTVREFVEEVVSNEREWGCIRVDIGEEYYWDNPTCEYKWGKLLSILPGEYLDKKIISGRSDGGWSQMDYLLKIEED